MLIVSTKMMQFEFVDDSVASVIRCAREDYFPESSATALVGLSISIVTGPELLI